MKDTNKSYDIHEKIKKQEKGSNKSFSLAGGILRETKTRKRKHSNGKTIERYKLWCYFFFDFLSWLKCWFTLFVIWWLIIFSHFSFSCWLYLFLNLLWQRVEERENQLKIERKNDLQNMEIKFCNKLVTVFEPAVKHRLLETSVCIHAHRQFKKMFWQTKTKGMWNIKFN